MSNKMFRKTVSLAMSTLLVISGGGICPQEHVARAEDPIYVENNILQILNPEDGTGKESTEDPSTGEYVGPSWVGNYIYYGNYPQSLKDGADPASKDPDDYNNDPIKWRILDNNNVQYIGSGQIDQTELETNNGFRFNVGKPSSHIESGYGGRQNAPVGGNGVLLMTDKLLNHLYYHYPDNANICWSTSKDSNDKKGSLLWAWLNDKPSSDVRDNTDYKNEEIFSFIEKAFTDTEKNGIMNTMVYAEDLDNNNKNGYFASLSTTISQDKLFIPSYNEMLNTKYGFSGTWSYTETRTFTNTEYAKTKSTNWSVWTRSHYYNDNIAPFSTIGTIQGFPNVPNGSIMKTRTIELDPGCLATFNLNQGAVIFASAANETTGDTGSKGKNVNSVPQSFNLPTGYDNEYKLTMQGDHDGFSITNKPASLKKSAGSEIELNYTGAKSRGNEYVSMILTQEKEIDNNLKCDEVKYYGKLVKIDSDSLKSGTAKIKLPSDIEAGNYKLKIFAEQCNGDKKTDWTSATQDINLEVIEELKVNEFEVSPIAHRTGYEQEVKVTLKGQNFDLANKLVVEFVDEDGTRKLSREAVINTGETEKTITFSANEMSTLPIGHYEIKATFYDNADIIGEVTCKDVYHVVGEQTISDIERDPSFLQLPFDSATIKVKFKLNGLEEGDTIVNGAAIFMNAVGDEITSSQAIVPNGFQPDECLVNDLKLPRLESGTYKIKGIMNFNHHDVISQSNEVEVDFEIIPEPTPEPTPTPTPTPTPSPSPTSSPAPTPTPSPTLSPSPTSMPTPSSSPTSSPAPIPTPSSSPIPTPTVMPTPVSPTSVPNPGEGSVGRFSWNVIDNNKIITPAPTPTKQIEKIETKTLRDIQKQVPQALKNIAYVVGNGDGTFKPENNITRAEAAQMIYKLIYNGTKVNYDVLKKFSDLNQTAWYSTAVAYLTDQGLIDGDGGKFYPNRQITRAEMSKILYNALLKYDKDQDKKLAYGTTQFNFTDIPNNWSLEPIKQFATNNMINGYGNDLFKPSQNITRAESVAIIAKVFGRSQDFYQRVSFKDVLQSHWAYNYIMNAVNGEN